MPIIKQAEWDKCVEVNSDPYGGCIVNIARKVMEYLDTETTFEPDELISRADKDTESGGITGFMAGAAASIVSQVHSRGEEFRKKWNKSYGVEGDTGGTVNPAILTIKT